MKDISKFSSKRIALGIVIAILLIVVCCFSARYVLCLSRAPICRSTEELFYVEPEILEAVHPYLAEWATLPESETEAERRRISRDLNVDIDVFEWDRTSTGIPVIVVAVHIERYFDWNRGFLYVDDNVELIEEYGYHLKRINDHLYAYNINN